MPDDRLDEHTISITLEELREMMQLGAGCIHCGCKLCELHEDGYWICARCERPPEQEKR